VRKKASYPQRPQHRNQNVKAKDRTPCCNNVFPSKSDMKRMLSSFYLGRSTTFAVHCSTRDGRNQYICNLSEFFIRCCDDTMANTTIQRMCDRTQRVTTHDTLHISIWGGAGWIRCATSCSSGIQFEDVHGLGNRRRISSKGINGHPRLPKGVIRGLSGRDIIEIAIEQQSILCLHITLLSLQRLNFGHVGPLTVLSPALGPGQTPK
jgi:hypothetical protein